MPPPPPTTTLYNLAGQLRTISNIFSLAYLDIYVILAVLFSRFELQLESPTPEHGLVWSDQLAVMLKTPIKVNVLADRWNK